MIVAEVENEIEFWISPPLHPPTLPNPRAILPIREASFLFSAPHLLSPSHPAESPQTDIFFQLVKQVKKYQYQERQRFRRLQRLVVREVLNPLGESLLSFPPLKKPSCPPTCLCKCLAKMMIYQLLSNWELSVS